MSPCRALGIPQRSFHGPGRSDGGVRVNYLRARQRGLEPDKRSNRISAFQLRSSADALLFHFLATWGPWNHREHIGPPPLCLKRPYTSYHAITVDWYYVSVNEANKVLHRLFISCFVWQSGYGNMTLLWVIWSDKESAWDVYDMMRCLFMISPHYPPPPTAFMQWICFILILLWIIASLWDFKGLLSIF